ncbi:hypothetical protein HanRHA438_Chr16g0755181 [Helianthus annuus]|nr:hypothetical protein HanRHA438_Chr16g0755181 [Helianthus annuus]
MFCVGVVAAGGGWEGGEVVVTDDKVRLKKSIMSSALVVFTGGGGSVTVKAILIEGSVDSFTTPLFGDTVVCAFVCLQKTQQKSNHLSEIETL